MLTKRQLARDTRMFLSRRLNRSLASPDRVSVNVTLRCNLKCTMCTTCYDSPELSLDEIKGIIDQTAAWGVEVFNPLGGEPFMRADIEEILAYAVRRGFYVTVTTNGTLITEKRAAAIAAIPADRLHFNISLDGAERENDAIRSTGMWRRAIQGLERIRAADVQAGNPRRKILANTILHARNLDHFEAVLDEQAALGFDGVQVLNLFRQGPEVPTEAANLWFHAAHMDALSALVERLALRTERQGVVGYRIQNHPDELRQIPRYYRDDLEPLEAPCWAGWKELYINADGEAIMCDGELDFLKGRFGNVREQTLKQLWASPALRERRAVVKKCTTPCVQNCYLRQESDSVTGLISSATEMAATRVGDRLRQLGGRIEERPEAILRLELSDICPCEDPDCDTPSHRWERLIERTPHAPTAQSWSQLRDDGWIDFGRGFMGFDVLRSVIDDVRSRRIRFGALGLRWRGEPLLHPEIGNILPYLLDTIAEGKVAQRLLIETDGRFLTESLAELASHPAAQTWVFDVDRGGWDAAVAGRELVEGAGHAQVQTWLAVSASPSLDSAALTARVNGHGLAVGAMPQNGTGVWVRRTHHAHYGADGQAGEALARIATELGVPLREEAVGMERRTPDWSQPTVSWDGKVTVCSWDPLLEQVVGDVVHGRLTEALAR